MGYFQEHKELFHLQPDALGLRSCQKGAVWALKSNQTTSDNSIASIISMPTGSGKTALMMAICFEMNISKVLILVPSKILRRQIADQFRTLEILKSRNCLDNEAPEVNVYEVVKRQNSRADWEGIVAEHDVIVAHPASVSPHFSNLEPLPHDLIDAVFMDEAHHEPAPTWKSLNMYYEGLKRVFFTATPFRRDRKRMRGKLVYHYPIGKALDDGILRPVEFVGVTGGLNEVTNDNTLIEQAVHVLTNERDENPSARILIRTDRIDDATRLKERYNAAGLNVDVIHSKRTANVNQSIITQVNNGEIDGLVAVGIASEGLDIPNLKVAVLHATPRSIPYTIQFLGRISRAPEEQIGSAILVANTDEVKGRVQKLYKADEDWGRLIPAVVDEQMQRARHYRSSQARDNGFQMPELNVFFSALVYEVPEAFDFIQSDLDLGPNSDVEVLHVEQDSVDSPLIVVTAHDKPIDWTGRSIFQEDTLDVHILYHNSERRLLFELTTSQSVLETFRPMLIDSELNIRSVSHDKLFRVLSEFNNSNYIMVGMRNSAMRGASHPAYKTLIGSGVQSAVRSSEGRVFGTGHALLRLGVDATWGIATKKGRVWAMQRGTAEEFKYWCDIVASLIVEGPRINSLPGLSFLASSTPIENIEERPIAVIPDDMFFRTHQLTIQVGTDEPLRNQVPEINVRNLDEGVLECGILIGEDEFQLIMDFEADKLWTIISDSDILIRADRYDSTVAEGTLEKILNENPPSLIMPSGGVIVGRNKITPNSRVEKLPSSFWSSKVWNNCNIQAERYVASPTPNLLPVINKTIELIQGLLLPGDVLVLDDGAHEIADLIWFNSSEMKIYFFHCKASSAPNPGCRRNDGDVLFAQALRCIHWVYSPELLDRVCERLEGNSQILFGTQNELDVIRENYNVNDWHYKMILPQPGFQLNQVSDRERANNNVYELAIPMYERIIGAMAEVEIWCSDTE